MLGTPARLAHFIATLAATVRRELLIATDDSASSTPDASDTSRFLVGGDQSRLEATVAAIVCDVVVACSRTTTGGEWTML